MSLAALAILLAAQSPAAAPQVAPVLTSADARDVHSYARPLEARVTHVSLNLYADFDSHVMRGIATLSVDAKPDAKTLVVDDNGLRIVAVTDAQNRPLPYSIGAVDKVHGAPLTITLNGQRTVKIAYASVPGAKALQWLSPEQTAGKKQPYLFSQGEAILNRSWIPTQDSPGIRQTWDATINAPCALTVVMSGERTGETPCNDGRHTASYRMDKPVAPYLIALAIGDLKFKPLSAHTGIWTEPAMLDKAAWEFAGLDKFVSAAEGLYGPYRWGRYDVLVLPPSFPFGGMENPMLTFATPTVLAGDRSLVSLIAHELAHSWSGNLVTNATWDDFWLNEGFTSYFENRIMESMYGKRRAAMEADLAWTDMQNAVKEAGGPQSPDTKLHLDLNAARDPDDGMTQIAYDKGATFLRTIESVVGRPRWDAYLRSYFDRHAFQPQTSAGFLADLRKNLLKPGEAEKIGVDQWVYQPGIPANAVHVRSDAFPAIDAAAKAFAAGGPVSAVPDKVTTQEYVRFLDQLPRQLSAERLAALDGRFHWNETGNSEIRFAWLRLALANRYQPAEASAEQFLTSQGRRKFVAPLFQQLQGQGEWGKVLASRIYDKARSGYHSVTQVTVDRLLGR
ncbi:M1 family metallopeptidase [Sphingomonas sanguinis]|jgi:leukotriene-A4 hydrolase|uniref:Aminopeptidase N n=1 Tax=Sphingomonas sanguinis TaxID=33051 RepID=A0A7Y7QSV3_9SPHN|nr:M1 family metallopeptidase [Sphingomonas sanguinis]MBZ6380780.1 M1 family metallopeptidase [Sphingomonas sanguinis]NNG49409.1 M1 family metallopeptidase [Sphingomonas sanguinis]NNG53413.1 M1 family metallopeptidase [Sphingomonas sanguinis]NVP30082.1 M1 family metallopeptidase [Sphingomonas sanguinis]